MKLMQVAALEECTRVNVRAKINAEVVREYAEAYEANAVLPPIVVFQEKGCERYIVADGRHRVAAAKKVGKEKIDVDLHVGDETDALKYALSCNSEHGLRRNRADLLHAVSRLMANAKLADMFRTHVERAELLKISERTFQRLLADWRGTKKSGTPKEHKAKTDAQESATKHTAPKKEPKPKPSKPTLEQKKVAAEVRQSVATPKPNGALPTAALHDFKRGIGLVNSCELDMAKVATNGVDWTVVEGAADKLSKLLEHR